MRKSLIKLKRMYHRWCLRNAIAYHGMKINAYHASTNSYTVTSPLTGWRYHAFVSSEGKVIFRGIVYD